MAADRRLAIVSLMPDRGMSTKLAPGAGMGGGAKAAGAAGAPERSPLFSEPYRPEPWPVDGVKYCYRHQLEMCRFYTVLSKNLTEFK